MVILTILTEMAIDINNVKSFNFTIKLIHGLTNISDEESDQAYDEYFNLEKLDSIYEGY